MQGITFSGLGSGLDTAAIINQLVALERIPIGQIESQKKAQQTKLDLIGTLKGLVRDLQKEAEKLSTASGFGAFTVTPSVEGVAALSAAGSAAPGTHTLEVTRLAAVDRWAFDGVSDATTPLATADGQAISFSVGAQAYSVAVDQATSSLEQIAAAINSSAAAADVQATVVNAGTTASPDHQLVLTARRSGEEGRITGLASAIAGLTVDGTGPDGSGVAQSANNITVGSNAIAVVDGLTVERESNELNDVLQGVDITLQSLTAPGAPISFSVETDTAAVKKKLEDFVDAYNEVVRFVNTQNTYDEENGTGGKLFGDALLRSVRNELGRALFGFDYRQDTTLQDVIDDTEGYSTLAAVGVDLERDGTLSIDSTVLEEKLADDPDALADLFADADGFDNAGALVNTPGYYQDASADAGLAAILDRVIERMFDTFEDGFGNVRKGLFDSRTETLQDAVTRYDKQIEDKEYRLEQFEQNLRQRFAALEEVMGALNAQGAALNAALLGLS